MTNIDVRPVRHAPRDGRVVVIRGPKDFDPATALFSQGIEVGEGDRVVALHRRGNVEIEIFERS